MSRDSSAGRGCSMPRCPQSAVHSVGPGALCDYHFRKLQLDDSAEDDGASEDSSQEQSTSTASGTETTAEPSDTVQDGQDTGIDLQGVAPNTYPKDLVENGARWLLWQYNDDRKVPRNPAWGYSDHGAGYAFAGAKDSRAWFEFDKATGWVDHDDDLGLAYYLTNPDRDDRNDDEKYDHVDPADDVPDEPHVGLLDFDDIRDPETGAVAPAAAELLERLVGTFCALMQARFLIYR
ncbi:hypothetical protein [Haladaptatus sp. NG-WS-4]